MSDIYLGLYGNKYGYEDAEGVQTVLLDEGDELGSGEDGGELLDEGLFYRHRAIKSP